MNTFPLRPSSVGVTQPRTAGGGRGDLTSFQSPSVPEEL
jgi:hypothetical protein